MKPIRNFLLSLLPAALLAAASLPASAAGQTFALDPYHTEINLSWSHFGLSNPGAALSISEGTLVWDAEDPAQSSIQVTIPADSVHTRAAALTDKFKKEYFEAAQYPAIRFEGTGFERVGLSNRYRVTGHLTLRDIRRPVTLEAVLNNLSEHPMLQAPAIGFDATATLMRSDFGLDADVPFVSDEIQIRITGEGLEPAALARMVEMVEAEAQQ